MWTAELSCGHHAPTPDRGHPPKAGQWISCRPCQQQREVRNVTITALFPAS